MATPYLPLAELHLVGVAEPNVPNQERVVIRPTQPLDLNGYAIAIGIQKGNASAMPIFDQCFWFPRFFVAPPCWIVVYTGAGQARKTEWQGETVYIFHWQRTHTIFTDRILAPVLFRVDAASVGFLLAEPAPTSKLIGQGS